MKIVKRSGGSVAGTQAHTKRRDVNQHNLSGELFGNAY